jgi:hypothetical protein
LKYDHFFLSAVTVAVVLAFMLHAMYRPPLPPCALSPRPFTIRAYTMRRDRQVLESSPAQGTGFFVHSPHATMLPGTTTIITHPIQHALMASGGVQVLFPLLSQFASTTDTDHATDTGIDTETDQPAKTSGSTTTAAATTATTENSTNIGASTDAVAAMSAGTAASAASSSGQPTFLKLSVIFPGVCKGETAGWQQQLQQHQQQQPPPPQQPQEPMDPPPRRPHADGHACVVANAADASHRQTGAFLSR